jgi:hypothetical protein
MSIITNLSKDILFEVSGTLTLIEKQSSSGGYPAITMQDNIITVGGVSFSYGEITSPSLGSPSLLVQHLYAWIHDGDAEVVKPVTQNLVGDGTDTLDFSVYDIIHYTFTVNAAFTIVLPTYAKNWQLQLTQGGVGSFTVSDWDDMQWYGGGTAPTLSTAAGSVDLVSGNFDGSIMGGVFSDDRQ